ncbi:hypothetical protein C8J56DRAFT_890514 [Mycena floridula]|nr:hypothetical protein C8J56DRAFT_890514 [Mycena floridula]
MRLKEHWTALHAWLSFGLQNILLPVFPVYNLNPGRKERILQEFSIILTWFTLSDSRLTVTPLLPGFVKLSTRLYLYAASVQIDVLWNQQMHGITGPLYDRSEFVEALQETPNSVDIILSDLKAISPISVKGKTQTSGFTPLVIASRLVRASRNSANARGDSRMKEPHDVFVARGSIPLVISCVERINFEGVEGQNQMDWTVACLNLCWIVRDFLMWFLKSSIISASDLDAVHGAHGQYPAVVITALVADQALCGKVVMSGHDFLESEVKWESDEIVKTVVRERTSGVVIYAPLEDTGPVPFHFYHVFDTMAEILEQMDETGGQPV